MRVARLAGRDEDLKQIAAMHQSIGVAEISRMKAASPIGV